MHTVCICMHLEQVCMHTVCICMHMEHVCMHTEYVRVCIQAGGLEQPAGSMLVLPLLDFPNGQYILSSTWRLPNGRDGNQHHLFPVEVPTDPTARQGPMLPADHFTTSALDVQLHAVVGKPTAKHGETDVVVLQSGCLAFPAHYDFQDSVLRLPVIIPAPQAAHAQSKLHVCVYIHLNWAVRILYSRFEWHLN